LNFVDKKEFDVEREIVSLRGIFLLMYNLVGSVVEETKKINKIIITKNAL
jgi:hypothetical protein